MLTPELYQIETVTHETADVYTLALRAKKGNGGMAFLPGQYNMLYHFGFGEAAISISGDPVNQNAVVHTIRAVGSVTQGMQKLKPGDEIGVRGPFGAGWPLIKKQCDVLVIAGGIGLAPLRPALYQLNADRGNYSAITLLYGARNPQDMIYIHELDQWQKRGIRLEATVDFADLAWQGQVGVVTALIRKNVRYPDNTLVLICGPEIMIKFALHELMGANVDKKNIYLSLERHMQCSTGFCGRCQLGPYFLCKDGPVFSYEQVERWLKIKEL